MSEPSKAPSRFALKRWILSDTATFTLIAVLVGLLTGFATIGFVGLIRTFGQWSNALRLWLGEISPLLTVLIPALGGLGAGLLITYVAEEMRYGGIPAVLEAIALRGSRLRGRLIWAKLLATALCIGSGGSAGRVGPIAQIGAALGSYVGQRFHLTDERIRSLVACGAAAGIASTFNAPIAGVIFALEVILGEFTETAFSAILISAVTSSIVSRSVLGTAVAFTVQAYALSRPLEILYFALLGVLAALVAWAFITTFYATKALFARLHRLPAPLRPALGGLLLGLVALVVPQVLGGGFGEIDLALQGRLSLRLMAILVVAKLLATDVTLGSGSSGGLFAPALFMGAMLGGAFGEALHRLMPLSLSTSGLAPSSAYALVGMAAVFGAAAHAPMTALLIVFEMSGSYSLILPLMLTTGISTVIVQALQTESIYTLALAQKGIHIRQAREMDVLQNVRVARVMTDEPVTVQLTATLAELSTLIDRTRHRGYPVVDAAGKLVGIVSLQDLELAQQHHPDWAQRSVADLCSRQVITAYPDEPVSVALQRMGVYDVSRLPVVAREDSGRLLGVIHRSDIGAAYQYALVQWDRGRRPERYRAVQAQRSDEIVTLAVPDDAAVVGLPIRAIAWPPGCLIVAVHRGDEVLVGRGDVVIHAGDNLMVYARDQCVAKLRALLT